MPAFQPLPANHPEVLALRALHDAAQDAHDVAFRLEAARNAHIRSLVERGVVGSAAISRLLGLTRPRIWQILNPPDVDTDDAHMAQADALVALMDRAIDAWQAAGRQGDPDDFFDLGDVQRAMAA